MAASTATSQAASSPRYWIFALLTGLILAVERLVVTNPALIEDPDVLALGVTLDLVVGLPVLGYFFLVRPGRAPWWILLVLFIEGMIVAKLLLPAEQEQYLRLAEFIAPAAELALIGLLVLRARTLVRTYRSRRPHHLYKIDAVEESLAKTLGTKAAGFVISEIAVLVHALGGWWHRPMDDAPGRRVFAYHRRGGYPAVFGAFVFLVVIETAVVHLLVSQWSTPAAWIVSALGIVGLLWMLGDFQAMRHEPIVATPSALEVRAGLRWRARVSWSEIQAVRETKPDEAGDELSLPILGAPDFWIELDGAVPVRGIYGIRRTVRFLGIGVDDASGLRHLIDRQTELRAATPDR